MDEYMEIRELFVYCHKHEIDATLEPLFDGYKLGFPSGGDIIQHRFSYGAIFGCVEPCIGSRLDFTAVPLKNAKALVLRHKDRLNGGEDHATDSSR